MFSDLGWIVFGVILRLPMCSRFELLFWNPCCRGLCPRQCLVPPTPLEQQESEERSYLLSPWGSAVLLSPWGSAVTPVDFAHRCHEGSGSVSGGCFSSEHSGCLCLSPCPWVTLRHPCPNGQHLAVSCSGSIGLGRLPRFRPRGLPHTTYLSVLSCTCP